MSGMMKGSQDEVVFTFTDSEVTIAPDWARQLDKCKPWQDHLDETAIQLFRNALNNKDSELARSVIDASSKKDTATPWCLDLFKTVAKVSFGY